LPSCDAHRVAMGEALNAGLLASSERRSEAG